MMKLIAGLALALSLAAAWWRWEWRYGLRLTRRGGSVTVTYFPKYRPSSAWTKMAGYASDKATETSATTPNGRIVS